MSSLKDRVKSLQADTTNTDTALTTLEEALAEKVSTESLSTFLQKVLLLMTSLKLAFPCASFSANKTSLMQCHRDILCL